MKSVQKMSEAESEVMRVVWAAGGPVTSQVILAELNKRKDWKPTTVLTFLTRLTEKGLLRTEKRKKVNYYTPVFSEDEYKHLETRAFLETVHEGSVKNLLAALYDADDISPEEIEELKKWFSER
ncbi:transcriptional regulator [Paenibacillus faecis]|uniref:BlaI/MecI/CopY family transcriptional regulator n=1 Tax=Paenibacillus faecis TaxID=862114 RepID=A0A5D0CY43_9BACL|nr:MULTISPECIES: BlaI/MecI/CopY family transcriptional regulator [Paenibacillus]MCA1291725.1 BlaI/MecI/CopY family transcriptional regulator [Paenibacillus sp. alder61]TYA14959.1 BlaI/MecI/CopY family transcriptional regulator [Paenibacillus faecis]GIO86424.1 transcriptional regulator [Paenibacillus faecis]